MTAPSLPQQRRAVVLVSSMSARGKALTEGPAAVRALHAAGWQLDVRATTSDEDPRKVAASVQAPYVIAIGGDGYLAAVVEGLEGSGRVLIPFPGGRGNDLCRSLGVDVGMEARTRRIAHLASDDDLTGMGFQVKPLDAIEVVNAGTRRLAVGAVSFGIDAWANILGNRAWLRSGPLAYAWGAITAPRHFHGAEFRAVIDGHAEKLPGWVFTVANTGMIGGGVRISVSSDPGDGRIELVHVGQLPLKSVVPILMQVLMKRTADTPVVGVRHASEITLLGPDGTIAMADGDEIGRAPIRMSVVPRVVDVLV